MAKLVEHLPQIMRQFTEMQQIMSAEDKELEAIEEVRTTIFKNAFIESCDENGIERFEKMLGILNSEEGVEMRRTRVAIRWNEEAPYTYETLTKCLDSSLGQGNYELSADEETYYLQLRLNLKVADCIEIAKELLERRLPENVRYEITIIYNTHATLHRFTHAQLHNYTHRQLREKVLP